MTLPDAFLTTPLAHRGLHDRSAGVIENSATAFEHAIAQGFGIELDVQMSKDARAMVFHDYDMARLTGQSGAIQTKLSRDLAQTTLTDGTDVIQDLPAILKLVAGRAPLLIEIKDQDGAMGPNVGPLEHATAQALSDYQGPVAVMSFNPHSVAKFAEYAPDIPRGLTTSGYDPQNWPLPNDICATLRGIPDYARTGACFISHEAADLNRPRVSELKDQGAAILCWTIRSKEAERDARKIEQNVTFEGYVPT